MSFEAVQAWLNEHAPDIPIIRYDQETATVADAAAVLRVEPARIAKTLALRVGDRNVVLVTSGEARLDNAKCKAALGNRPRMLDAQQTLDITGHPVGGVCPFALASDAPVYCDVSLQSFATVFPAAGSRTSSVEVEPQRLMTLVGGTWVNVCKVPSET
ncbi:MAG: YbaK/EbsC family protein [Sphingobium sp.]